VVVGILGGAVFLMEGERGDVIHQLQAYQTSGSAEDFWKLQRLLYPADDSCAIALGTEYGGTSGRKKKNKTSSDISGSAPQRPVLSASQYQAKITDLFTKDLEELYSHSDFNGDMRQIEYLREVLSCDFNDYQKAKRVDRN
jgi:hypothetical protein